MMALFLVVLLGITGFSVDMGHVMWVQRQLQSAADAAALAGAEDVVSAPGNAVTLANTYSASRGQKNAFLASNVSTTATLKCLTVSVTFPTCSGGTYNAILVTEQTEVQMWFTQILGIKTATVVAQSMASAKGGQSQSLDIMVVLDTTASMNTADSNCSGGSTRIACAKYGVIQLLTGLNPQLDWLGVMVFPGYNTTGQANSQSTCSPTRSGIAKYAPYNSLSPPYYTVAAPDNTFKSGPSAKTLATSSSVVIAAGGGTCGTSGGIQAVGGVGTDYGQAILGAEKVLANDGHTKAQKVIVFLSDGDANASSSNITGGLSAVNQCQQAVAAAKAAALQGMWVYSVAYGSSTAGNGGSCSTDKNSNLGTTTVAGYSTTVNGKGQSACWTMGQIASDPSKFYSDNAAGCVGTGGNDKDLTNLFKSISASLTMPRLIPTNST